MLSELSKAHEVSVSALTGAHGAPIAAWIYWTLFHAPICDPNLLSPSGDYVVTVSGESRSWLELARTPAAVVLGPILAGLAYLILDVLIESKKTDQA